MSITFGSVGDIIAVGQIAFSLAKSLSDSKGSAKEYQGLSKDLHAFDQALLQVVALWQNYESSPELDQLGTITKDAVTDWRDTLLAFRVKVDNKYGTSLVAGGSGNWMRDAGKKIVWLKEKKDILDLRRKLGSASDAITMLTLAAMGKSNRLAESTMECRVQAVHCLLLESKTLVEEQVAQLKKIDERMETQSKTSDLILGNVKSGMITLTNVHAMIVDVKNILALFHSHIGSQQSTPRGLVTGWQQDPVTLEDALGFRIPLPLELVNSWDMLDLILSKRFEKRPGHQKILKGEFAIEEGTTGRDISREYEFCMSFRPGQKIDMTMVFADLDGSSNRCPRCRTKSEVSAKIRTQCTSCRMWFQRLVEIDESDYEPLPVSNKGAAAVPQSSVRAKEPKAPVSTPADFQRVRLTRTLRLSEQKENDERYTQVDVILEEELARRSASTASEDEPYTIKCICEQSEDDGNAIYCETCDTWQHIECFYPGKLEEACSPDFSHSCADCKPRPLNRRRAIEWQRSHPIRPSLPSHPLKSSQYLGSPSLSSADSPFRPSKWEWDARAAKPEGAFQTSTFKNIRYNTAHYQNQNFSPEEWNPDHEEADHSYTRGSEPEDHHGYTSRNNVNESMSISGQEKENSSANKSFVEIEFLSKQDKVDFQGLFGNKEGDNDDDGYISENLTTKRISMSPGGKSTRTPIKMVPAPDSRSLDSTSRLDYAKIYTVEHNVKVYSESTISPTN